MSGHWNTWGRVSQVQKLGYERYIALHTWQGEGNRSGMPADAQVSLHDLTAHVQRFFPPKCRSRWQWHHLMMSLMSFLCKLRVGIRRSMHKTWGHSFIHYFHLVLLACSLVGPSGKPQTLLTQLPQCLLSSGIITRQGSIFYLFNCMCLGLS